MEIRPWGTAIMVCCHTIEVNLFSCHSMVISKEEGSILQIALGPKDPTNGCTTITDPRLSQNGNTPLGCSSLYRLPYSQT